MASGEYSGSRSACAVMVVMEPATPTTAVARSSGTSRPASAMAASTSASAAAICSAVGGSLRRCRSVSRTQPMSTDLAAMTPSALPSTNSVLPPPRSTTSTWSPSRDGQDAAGAGEGQRGFLVAGDDLGFHAEEVADAVHEDLPVAGVAAGGGGHEADLGGAVLADQRGVVARWRRRCAPAPPGASSPVASTPWPSRTTRISRTTSVSCGARRCCGRCRR